MNLPASGPVSKTTGTMCWAGPSLGTRHECEQKPPREKAVMPRPMVLPSNGKGLEHLKGLTQPDISPCGEPGTGPASTTLSKNRLIIRQGGCIVRGNDYNSRQRYRREEG